MKNLSHKTQGFI